MKAKHWYDYLWVYAIIYFALGFFNILFAWLGMIDFLLPLFLAIFGGNKFFCNHLCGRGQLFSKLGTDLKCSRCKPTPRWMSSKWFRYGFLLFFLTMFGNMVFQTYLVAAGAASLREAIKLFWTFRVPWGWTYTAGTVADWVAQFSFGFYSLMLTSLLLGLIVMVLYKPRTWCAFCPMGTMTQGICKLKNKFSFDVFYFAHNISPTLSSSETITIPILLKEYPQLPLVLLSLFSYSLKSFYDPYILP